ncbi:MAG: NAD-dependent epimerase, partial [Myxococcaceae bacterium]
KVKPRQLTLTPTLLKGLASVADVVSRTTGKHLPLNRKLAKQLLAPAWTCSMEKAHRLLGFKAKRGLEESIRESGRWYVQHGWL